MTNPQQIQNFFQNTLTPDVVSAMTYQQFIDLFTILKEDIQGKSQNLKCVKETLTRIETDISNSHCNIERLQQIEEKHREKKKVVEKVRTVLDKKIGAVKQKIKLLAQ